MEPSTSAEEMFRVLRIVKSVDVKARDDQDPRTDDRFVSILQKMI